jgi:hypothetical protein
LGKRLFIRVPLPAAMITTSTAAMTVLWVGETRRASRDYRRWRVPQRRGSGGGNGRRSRA